MGMLEELNTLLDRIPDFKRVGTDAANPMAAIGFTADLFQCGSCGHREQRHRDAFQN